MDKVLKLALIAYVLIALAAILVSYVTNTYGILGTFHRPNILNSDLYYSVILFTVFTTILVLVLRFAPHLGKAFLQLVYYFLAVYVAVLIVYPLFSILTGSTTAGVLIGFFSIFPILLVYHRTWNRFFNFWAVLFAILGSVLAGMSYSISFAIGYFTFFAAYDYVAVFITKHMQFMVKAILTENNRIPQLFIFQGDIASILDRAQQGFVRHEKGSAGQSVGESKTIRLLGLGDLVIPGTLSATMVNISPYLAIIEALAAFAGLILNQRVMMRYRVTLPALPLILAPQFAVIVIYMAVISVNNSGLQALYTVLGLILVPLVFMLMFYTARMERNKIDTKDQML